MRNSTTLVALAALAALTGCASTRLANDGMNPSPGDFLGTMLYWGTFGGAAYLVLDPLAPNWDIEEAMFPEDRYYLSLRMNRFYRGGAGEARVVFHRRARELMHRGGFDGYQVLEYTESMESSTLGAQRASEGVIQLTRK